MIINRKGDKKAGQGFTISHTEEKVKYNFDYNTLSLFCSYILSNNKNIRRGHLVNLRNLVSVLDKETYKADPERLKVIDFIEKGLEARLQKGLNDKRLIATYIKGGILETDDKSLEEFSDLNTDELNFVNEVVAGALNTLIVQNEMEHMKALCAQYTAKDYKNKAEMVGEIRDFFASTHNKFRNVDSKIEDDGMFSFDPNTMEDELSDIYDSLTSANRFLRTQMVGLNTMLGGGLESTRFYLLLGNAGIGKSLTMLNMALQIKREHKGFITKDPTKKPTIVFLTQENSKEETIDRLFSIISGGNKMNHYSKEEVYRILKEDGELTIEGDNNINIHIIYKPDRSIDTGDLYSIIEDLEDRGYETICLFQDHIKRIRSINNYTDLRLELGAVVNEMKTLAIIKDIPVISVSHLNRDAAKVIDENVTANKADLTRLLGRSNVGESMLMIDNSDAVIIIGKEHDPDGNEYIAFNLIKLRYAQEVLKFICYPFNPNNGLEIMTDTHLSTPIYKETMRPETNMIGVTTSSYTSVNSIAEDNIFKNVKISKEDSITAMIDSLGCESFSDSTVPMSVLDSDVIPMLPINKSIDLSPSNEPIQLVSWI